MKKSISFFSILMMMLLLISCNGDTEPEVEVYISGKKSDIYQRIKIGHATISLDQVKGGSTTIQPYLPFASDIIELSEVEESTPILIRDYSIYHLIFDGLQACLINIEATKLNGSVIIVNTYPAIKYYKSGVEFDSGEFYPDLNKRYRIDLIYDFDASIIFNEPDNDFNAVLEIKIEEIL